MANTKFNTALRITAPNGIVSIVPDNVSNLKFYSEEHNDVHKSKGSPAVYGIERINAETKELIEEIHEPAKEIQDNAKLEAAEKRIAELEAEMNKDPKTAGRPKKGTV